MKKKLKSISFYVILFIALFLVYSFVAQPTNIEKNTMSDLMRSIENGQVTGIIVEETAAIATLKNGKEMIVEIPSANLFLTFATQEIKELIMTNPTFTFDTPAPVSPPWWLSMLPYLVFGVIIIVFWLFFFRNMQGGGGGGKVMNFGKSRAKNINNAGKKVTFKVCEGIDIGDILPVKG